MIVNLSKNACHAGCLRNTDRIQAVNATLNALPELVLEALESDDRVSQSSNISVPSLYDMIYSAVVVEEHLVWSAM